jgi:putative flippase GtrA
MSLKIAQLWRVARSSEGGRFLLFLAVGGMNTLVGYAFFVAFHAAGLAPVPAVICATVAGVLFNFLSTGRIVFGSSRKSLLPRFVAVYAVQCAANLALLHGLLGAGFSILFAEAIVMALLAVATYFAMKKFVFPNAPASGPNAS